MSAGVLRFQGHNPAASTSSRAGAGGTRAGRPEEPLLNRRAARGAALLALALFGGLHWMIMLDPSAPGKAWAATFVAVAVMIGMTLAARLGRFMRFAAAVAVTLAGAGLAFLASGGDGELLWPSRWDELAAGIGQGIEALPGVRVPYRGLEEWLRLVIPLGGAMIVALAAALAFWPRRNPAKLGVPGVPIVLLLALYVTPTVALSFEDEFARGALLSLLVVGYLRLERLRRRDGKAALAVGAIAMITGLVTASVLDKEEPWWDYESWALNAASARSTTFGWNHTYGTLDWPRDGREVLRIKAKFEAYWKAANLNDFDGRTWSTTTRVNREAIQFQLPPETRVTRQWRQRIQVTVRNLRSEEYVAAGTTLGIDDPGRAAIETSPGTWMSSRALRRGDAYKALVYTPRPIERQLRNASSDYDEYFNEFLYISIDGEVAADSGITYSEPAGIVFPSWESLPRDPVVIGDRFEPDPPTAEELLEGADLGRTYRLAQDLRRESETPYEFVRNIMRHLRDGYTYTEAPPADSQTLEGFLFDGRSGYCQQFSGAMALLLRMGGVPARVATGFTPGALDRKRNEYVVRDQDAHSWVEVWFPGYGWVPFDPTPSQAPPRSQGSGNDSASAAFGDANDLGTSQRLPDLGNSAASDDGGQSGWLFLGLVVLIVGGVPATVVLVRRVRARTHDPARRGAAGVMLELERALRRSGRTPTPETTLAVLERHYSSSPAAAGYLRAVRTQRYSPSAPSPTPEQRRGLRHELARGGGPLGRLKALWALPPRRRPY